MFLIKGQYCVSQGFGTAHLHKYSVCILMEQLPVGRVIA